ncbi:hypothetical protein L596_010684 [Steinernema carpocapsae]|uniref:Uncharacterized protein n=1 Tax=Steinernema carpocapsae TaxID=34508 RepID=A0A4U5PJS4_STECR|nr:hypothetical protein L596_010684 [Steinernema carpocapsae]
MVISLTVHFRRHATLKCLDTFLRLTYSTKKVSGPSHLFKPISPSLPFFLYEGDEPTRVNLKKPIGKYRGVFDTKPYDDQNLVYRLSLHDNDTLFMHVESFDSACASLNFTSETTDHVT